jgi:hypothetical protein
MTQKSAKKMRLKEQKKEKVEASDFLLGDGGLNG